MKKYLAALAFAPIAVFAASPANDVGAPSTSQPSAAAYSFSGTMGSTTQQGRIFRDAVASTCPSKAYPGIFNATTTYNYDQHVLYNNGPSQCVTVNFDPNVGASACGTNAHASAYLNSYDPNNQGANFLGDVGSSETQPFSFSVPSGARVVLVVTNTSAVANCTYAFSAPTLSRDQVINEVPALDGKLLTLVALLLAGLTFFVRSRAK